MTVKELKEKLEHCPDNMDVFIDERVTDFTYGLLNTVTVKGINFVEEPGSEVLARETCVILSEQ